MVLNPEQQTHWPGNKDVPAVRTHLAKMPAMARELGWSGRPRLSSMLEVLRILFDDGHRLVANAGLLLPATLDSRHLGLREDSTSDHHLDLGMG